MNITDSILKSKKSTPTPQPQQLTNQYSGNQASISFSNTGESNINTGTAHVNVIARYSGEDSSEDSNPIPHKVLARMTIFFPTFHTNHTLCKVSKHITALFTKLSNGLNIADAGADTHVVGNTWKPLFEVNDSTPRADVISFDTNAAHKRAYQYVHMQTKLLHQWERRSS